MKNTSKPILVTENNAFGKDTFEHNAFGKVTVTKSSIGGKGTSLFGSNLLHSACINITIEHAQLSKSGVHESIFGRGTLVEFSMSEAQWAHFVASQGDGSGTPVTLNYAPASGYKLETCDHIDTEVFTKHHEKYIEKQAKKYMTKATELLQKLEELCDGSGNVKKTELRQFIHEFRVFNQNLPADMGYLQTMIEEAMEKTVEDGKIEIESFVTNMALRTGMDIMKLNAPHVKQQELENKE